jgi:nicotinamide mononucleotide transporter
MIGPLEIAANLVTTVSILLAGRNSIHTWWTGIAGCVVFGVLFHDARLYADVALQAFFLVTGATGWWAWLHGRRGAPLPITRSETRLLLIVIPAGVLTASAYGALLFHFTDAFAPYVDSAVLVFSVIAQFLLMRRKLETWLFWLLVNTISVPLFASRDLYLTAFLYSVYWVNALVSWFVWRRRMSGENESLAGSVPVRG